MLSEAEMVVTLEAEPKGIRVKSHASMTCPDISWRGEIWVSYWMRDLQQAKQQRFLMGSYVQLRSWHLVQCSKTGLVLYRNPSVSNLKPTEN